MHRFAQNYRNFFDNKITSNVQLADFEWKKTAEKEEEEDVKNDELQKLFTSIFL